LSAKSFIRKLQKIFKVIKQDISWKRMRGSPNQNLKSMYEAKLYRLVRGRGKIPFFRGTGKGMIIKSFVSDRHTSIAKWMREDCPKKCEELGKPVVQHYFDIWHIGKSKLFYTMNNHNFTNETVKRNISKYHPLPSCLWP